MVNVNKIRALAKKRGLKLKYICEQIGVSSTYFSDVDNGRYNMSDDKIQAIASILNTTYDYLTDKTDSPDRNTSQNRSYLYDFDWLRFELCCKEKHLTTEDVASQANISAEYYLDVKIGAKLFNDDQIKNIADCLGTTYEYLTKQTDNPDPRNINEKGVKIKVFGEVAAGIPIEQIDNFDPDDPDDWEEIDLRTARGGEYFALRIKGDSMEPRMFDGDIVIVRYQQTIEDGEIAIVAINGDTATCKRVRKDTNGIYLLPLNSKYIPKFYSNNEIENLPVTILGKVVEVRGKL